MDANKVAEIIAARTQAARGKGIDYAGWIEAGDLIDALADAYEAEQDTAHVTLKHRGPKEDCGWPMCREPFDREAFKSIAKRES